MQIFEAYKHKNLVQLTEALHGKTESLKLDDVVFSQLELLYHQLLEKNVLKLITPFSRIELSHLARKL